MRFSSFDPVSDPERAARVWRAIEGDEAPTFFRSWAWMGTWLRLLPAHAHVEMWVAREGGQDVAAFFTGARSILRHGVIVSRASFLNHAGLPEDDALYIEHNGPIVRAGARASVDWDAFLKDMGGGWDEMFFAASDPADVPAVGDRGGYVVTEQRRVPSPFVDLAAVRASAGGYPALLGKSTRTQIARARRLYRDRGTFRLQIARDACEASDIFDELVELHRVTWEQRGQEGAFASVHMLRFHREIIREHAATGRAQLVRLVAGGKTVGCLYNLLSGGHVAFYQSGLRNEDDNRFKPGLVCHAETIAANALLGHRVYDFLAGTSRYKTDLATGVAPVVWMRAARKRRRFWIEDRARDLRGIVQTMSRGLRGSTGHGAGDEHDRR